MKRRNPDGLRRFLLCTSHAGDACDSFELEQIGESRHGKHLLQFAVQSADKDMAAFGLGILQDRQEDAQSA